MTGVITDFLSVVNNQVVLLKHKHSAYTHIFPLKYEIIKSQLATVVPGQLNDASLNHEPSTVDAAAAVPETAGRRCCAVNLW